MPCSDDRRGSEECYERLQSATRAACDLVRAIRDTDSLHVIDSVNAETRLWIRNHDEMDRRNRELEAERVQRLLDRQEALRKLTPDERRALGIKEV